MASKKKSALVVDGSETVGAVAPVADPSDAVSVPVPADAVNLSIVGLVSAFEKAFTVCNEKFFEGLLSRPVITIAQGHKARAMGWVSIAQVWHELSGEARAHELNISSEYLNRAFPDIVCTLMHEMVHLDNLRNGVQDVARGGSRHNKKFVECAENHGMTGYKGNDFSRVGFRVKMTDSTAGELLPVLDFLRDAVTIARDINPEKVKAKKSGVLKYVCPMCGASVRATKEINILCIDCDEPMHKEERANS